MNEDGRFEVHSRVYEKAHGRWRETSWGSYFEDLSAVFPELAPYLKWDQFSAAADPYYPALQEIWDDVRKGTRSMEEFMWRISFGALPEDVMPPPGTPWREVLAWLEARHPRLVDAFRRDMRGLGRIAGPGFRTGRGFEGPKAWYPEMG